MTRRLLLIGAALTVVCMCASGTLLAQPARTSPQGVPYMSGGFGLDEQAALEASAGQYNLKLVFAKAEGNYLADVGVKIRGPVSLDAVSEGPWFYARLPAGSYTVTAENDGVAKTQSVSVAAEGRKTLMFRW